ncbi:MAG: VanZ family protein [Pedosphaera sp.]|nr:VanZ family protein [Pedosphaera sp.]
MRPARLDIRQFLSNTNPWVWVAVWMGVIFLFSTDTFSGSQTSRFIGPILKWFAPDITNDSIARVQLVVRKIAHLVEYAILSMLICRALAQGVSDPAPGTPTKNRIKTIKERENFKREEHSLQ